MTTSAADAMSPQLIPNPSRDQVQGELQSASALSPDTQPPPTNLPQNKAGTHVIWSQECRTDFEEWWGQKTTQKVAQHKLIAWGGVSKRQVDLENKLFERDFAKVVDGTREEFKEELAFWHNLRLRTPVRK